MLPPEKTIDPIDYRIIRILQGDAKSTIKQIAAQLKMTTTPVYDRIKRLERDGYILGYTATIDRKKLGFGITAFCSVTLKSHTLDIIHQFEADIRKLSQVQECYHIAGMFDYLLKISVVDMQDYQTFITEHLTAVANIGKVQSSFIMTEVKNDAVLP